MKKMLFTIMLLTSISVYAPILSKKQREDKELNQDNKVTLELLMDADFSESNLRMLLEVLQVGHIDEVIKQSKLETGWFKSKLFREQNNLFGMHMPYVRETYAYKYIIADNGRRVACYKTWQSSVLDFVLYLDYYKGLGYDTSNYHKFLVDAGYCEKGSYYITLLKSIS